MVLIPKIAGVLSCSFLLCLGLSGHAVSAADEMKANRPPDRQGGQTGVKGDQDKLMRDEMKAGQSARMGGQGVKGEEDKLKKDGTNADRSIDKKNEVQQNELGVSPKGGY